MKVFILLLLIAIPIFSQKIWEIDVTGNGNLTDVMEIPNSELLLFTYSSGRLEIRRGSDGSFVNQLISKQYERGGLKISNTGNFYFSAESSDTIEVRDISTNEPVMKISPIIESLEANPIFDEKYYKRCELFDNNTRLFCNFIYIDNDDQRNNKPNYIIYNLVTKQIEYQRPIDTKGADYNYSTIKKSYLSPDEKYIIEISAVKPRARMFNLQTKTYEFEFDGEVSEEIGNKIGALNRGRFQNDSLIAVAYADLLIIRSFPNLETLTNLSVYDKNNFFIGAQSGMIICDDIFICDVSERKENQTNKYDNYFIKYNYKTYEIIYSSKMEQLSFDYRTVFSYDNCSKVIVDRDINNNRKGIIACYSATTLDAPQENQNQNYFSQDSNQITFNSSEFIGQLATIDIYNSVGAKVGTSYNGIINQSNLQFQLHDLPSGSYHLQCQLPNQTLNFNFMVVI